MKRTLFLLPLLPVFKFPVITHMGEHAHTYIHVHAHSRHWDFPVDKEKSCTHKHTHTHKDTLPVDKESFVLTRSHQASKFK